MVPTRLFLLVCALVTTLGAVDNTLRVSPDGRSLVKADGSPFFWMGDTAWELFHRLNREQAEQYLSTRAAQGYTLIQAVALAELDGINTPNPYGHVPFTSTSPTLVPNEAYFQHVDWIVNRAAALGLYVGLLPTWGDKWNLAWGRGPVIFDTTDKARAYGQYIGNRYRNAPVVWIMGGDRNPGNDTHLAIIRAMAQGVEAGMGGRQLMTFHPTGGSTSATWFHNDAWLDLNMQQNGHCTNTDVWNRITNDRNRSPVKPVLDGEPLYESHPICFNAGANGYSNAADIRKFAYWNVFAGALGHTYGCHSVWQMYDAGRSPVNGPQQYWHQALTLPGAVQMGHVRRLMDSRPLNGRVPDQALLASDAFSGGDRIQATRGGDGGHAMVYSASGRGFTVDLGRLSGTTITAWWFDPRSGGATASGQFARAGTRAFTPPSNGYGNDWILVLDDAARGYPPPGGSGGNQAPLCQLTSPAPGSSHVAPASIALSATASDNDGTVVRVEFYAGAERLGEDTSAPYGFTWSGAPTGVHLLTARAYDDRGAVGTSSGVSVSVTPSGGGTFIGINLGGGTVAIEGNAWRADASARANGFTTNAPNVASTNVSPVPSTDADTRAMLNSALWGGGNLSLGQALGNGAYDVYLWVMENHQSNYRRFDVKIEGAAVASGIGDLALGAWRKYGPYRTTVGDGRLDVELVKVAGDPHVMGLAIVSAGAPPGGGSGSILRQWWSGVGGTSVAQIPLATTPSGSAQLASFATPVDWADDYGTRVSGWVHPPTSGTYRLWIAGDDNCELWLGTGDSSASRVRIAHVPGWTASQEWGKYAEQQSAAITLVGGQRYWIEALQKEQGGGDSLAVAWEGPGLARQVIAGQYLSPATAGGTPWSDGGVGSPGLAGSATVSGGTWTVRGGGDDIWNTSDSFHFVHRPMGGDGEITVRVLSQTATDPWAKAGVMIREGTAGGARHAMLAVTPGNGVAFQRRTTTGGGSAHTAGSRAIAPVWLRLTRVGGQISGYESGDGSSWRLVGSVSLTLGADVRIGMCVTSHDNGVLGTAVFEQVVVTTAPAGSG
jgi:hypothetical protein